MSLSLIRSAPEWGAAAFYVDWQGTPMIAVLGPRVDGAAEQGRKRAAGMIGRRDEGRWPLEDVIPYEGGSAWLYPLHPGICLVPVIDGALLPLRAACELIAVVSTSLLANGSHPGPMPEDVLIEVSGRVHLAGWVSPTNAGPERTAPGQGNEGASQIYRLAILALEILSGATPHHNNTADAHASMVRRSLIRVLSRPGPMVPQPLRGWLESCLCEEPNDRPQLCDAAVLLGGVATDLPGPTLKEWCAADLEQVKHQYQATDTAGTTHPIAKATQQDAEANQRTYSGNDMPPDDDITAISEGSTPRVLNRVELGTIPVSVGPPAEVARRRPTLPPELFSQEGDLNHESIERTPALEPAMQRLAIAAALLCVAAVLLSVYLFA